MCVKKPFLTFILGPEGYTTLHNFSILERSEAEREPPNPAGEEGCKDFEMRGREVVNIHIHIRGGENLDEKSKEILQSVYGEIHHQLEILKAAQEVIEDIMVKRAV